MINNYLVGVLVYNEELKIEEVIKGIIPHLYDANRTVIISNDGSTDDTANISKEIQLTYKNIFSNSSNPIITLTEDKNQGYGYNFSKVLNFARERKQRYLIILDGDYQHDPKNIIFFLNELKYHPVVHGNRWDKKSISVSDSVPPLSLFGREITKEILSLWDIHSEDPLCGYWGFDLNKIPMFDLTVKGYSSPLEFWNNLRLNNILPYEISVSRKFFSKDFLPKDVYSLTYEFMETTYKIINQYSGDSSKILTDKFMNLISNFPKDGKLRISRDLYDIIKKVAGDFQ